MARSGQASVDVVADFTRFAAQFQKDLNKALRGIRIDMTSVSDQISNGFKEGVDAANQELRRLGDTSGESFNLITQQSKRASESMAASFAAAGRQMSSVGDQMTMALSLPIAAVGTATVLAAGNFEKSMNRVKALSGATADEFAKLREQAIKLGSTTQYSASQAADAMGYLSMAGFDATQTLDALPGVLSLAASGSIELADAADIASNILSGYGFQARDLGKINDVLAKTFTSTNTTLTSLGETFKYIGPVAASAEMSFEEVSAAIGLMGNAGIQGSEAGTALRGSIARLVKPTADVTKTLKQLGVTVVDSSGTLLPLVDIVRQLETAGADTADMMTIFGLEAGPAMQALVSQGSGALAELTTTLQNAGGTADRIAKTQMEGFNGSLDELKSAAEGLMIAIGDAGLLGWMTALAQTLTNITASLSTLNPIILKVATIVGIAIAAIGPFLAIFGRMITAIGEGILAFKKFGAWAIKVAPWLSSLGGPIGLAIAAIVALGIAAVVAYQKLDGFRNVVDRAFRAVADAAIWMWQGAIQPAFNWIVAQVKVVGAALVSFWAQAQPILIAWGSAILGIWNTAIKPALGQIGALFGQAGSAIMAFWSGTAQPALASMMAWFGQLATAVRSWWTGNGDTVMRTAAQVVTWLGDVMGQVWTGIMTVLKGVAAVVVWAITNVVIPQWKVLIAIIKTVIDVVIRLKPIWMIIGAVIVGAVMVIIGVVKVLWSILTVAFRAIGAVVQWLWSSIIQPTFSFMGTVIEGLGAVVQWLWSSIIQPAFLAIATAIGAVGTVITWLWTSVFQPAFTAIGAIIQWVWSSIIQPVFSLIATAIGVVVSVITWFWNTFSPIFLAIANLLWTIWSGVFSVVFDLLKLAFYAVMAVVQVFWTVIQAVFTAVAGVVMAVWSGVIQPILSRVASLFVWLWGVIQPIVQAVGDVFSWLWSSKISPVISWVSSKLSWLWGIIKVIFSAVVSFIKSAISKIVSAASGVASFVSKISSYFQSAVNAIRSKINTVISVVKGLPGKIKSAVGNLGRLLYQAGQRVINGLIDGITSRIGALKSKIGEAAGTIRNALPFSPAKEGPLSGGGDPTIAGGKIVDMVAAGMANRTPVLRAAAWGVADASLWAPAGGLAGGLAPLTAATVGGGGRTTNIVFSEGAIVVTFSGVVPTEDDARRTGEAVGAGIADSLASRDLASSVRRM